MKISGVDLSEQVLVVAEIGNNHEGNFEVAQQMVRKAAEAGAGAVKFQTFQTILYVSRLDTARFNRIKSYELSYDQFSQLAELARSLGLLFISTPLDLVSADFLGETADAIKIASGDNDFYPLLSRVTRSGRPLIVSTGVSNLAQVKRTVDFVRSEWSRNGVAGELMLLHCVSSYPVPLSQVNLRSISALADLFGCPVGYSDHVVGVEAAVLSVALGARIVEKHFTLDKNFSDFRDHKLSADPIEMAELVRRIREAEAMLGVPQKTIQPCEVDMVSAVRRATAVAHDSPAGYCLTWDDLIWVRPAGDFPPGSEDSVIGRQLKRALVAGEQLHADDLV